MDQVLEALADERRRCVVRELRRNPGQRQVEMLPPLGLSQKNKGTLSKLLAPLEAAGVVKRDEGRYYVVESDAVGHLLSAAADVDVAAQRVLVERARSAVTAAERLANELRTESNPPTRSR
jgi:DNA-binding transcriptional ArsR family regulator